MELKLNPLGETLNGKLDMTQDRVVDLCRRVEDKLVEMTKSNQNLDSLDAAQVMANEASTLEEYTALIFRMHDICQNVKMKYFQSLFPSMVVISAGVKE